MDNISPLKQFVFREIIKPIMPLLKQEARRKFFEEELGVYYAGSELVLIFRHNNENLKIRKEGKG